MAAVAAPAINWSGSDAPLSQAIAVAPSTSIAPALTAALPAPSVYNLLEDPGVGYSS